MSESIFKTQPYAHQRTIFEASKDREFAALFMEQRTGKSKIVLDTAAYQYHANRIDALLIIAPSGVHRNWVSEEIPLHLHGSTNYRSILWQSGRMATKTAEQDLHTLLKHRGLAILAVNVDALITKTLKTYLVKFFAMRHVLAVADESIDLSSPGAARTKVAMRVARRSVMRRILDGTPVDAKPLGLYSQANFLQPSLLGASSYLAFKQRYAVWKPRDVGEHNRPCPDCEGNGYDDQGDRCPRCGGSCFVGNRAIQTLQEYQRLDELQERLRAFSYRVRRDECVDLPPKIRTKRFFALTQVQRQAYDALCHQFAAELAGQTVSAAMVLTRYLRLQQVSSNFLPLDGNLALCPACHGDGCAACGDQGSIGTVKRIETIDKALDPRLEALTTVLEPLDGQGLIWARFQHDVTKICRTIPDCLRYDGLCSQDERVVALEQFQRGGARFLVGNPHAGGRGLDLANANFVVYYSHDWSLRWRSQSEDRAQSLKKRGSVLYVDLIAEDTIDEKIIAALRAGKQLSDLVLGDPSF